MKINCPLCGGELTPAEIKKLWSGYTNSIVTPKRQMASRENGKKSNGRPRKPDNEIKPESLRRREYRKNKDL
jgi:hypothetical protein